MVLHLAGIGGLGETVKFGNFATLVVICMVMPIRSMGQPVGTSVQDFDEFDQQVETYLDQLDVPGAAVAIMRDGEFRHIKGYGIAGPGGEPVTPQTAFQTGSVSKSFAALVVLQLASEGKLGLDEPVVRYMPSFRTAEERLSDQITIEHLVTHRSGMTTLNGNRYQFTTDRSPNATADAVKEIADDDLFAEPGMAYQYSNANYATLAHLIELVDGQPYEQVLATRIFEPLEMRHSFVQVPTREGIPLAMGHRQWFGLELPTDFIAGRRMMAAGGVTASIEDLAHYVEAVRTRDPRIVPPKIASRLFAPHPIVDGFGYAYGWFVHDSPDFQRVFHDGLNPGFVSMAAMVPERAEVVVVLSNLSGLVQGNLSGAILNDALGLEPLDPRPSLFAHAGLWGLVALALSLVVWLAFTIRRIVQPVSGFRRKQRWVRVGLILGLLAMSYGLLVFMPQSGGATLRSAYMFYPDLAAVAFLGGISAALQAVGQLLLLRRG